MMILRFRLCDVELSYGNNTLTVGDRFKIVSEGCILCSIYNSIITFTGDDKFTVRVVTNDNITVMTFESEPEDIYGDNYSMDISNVSVLVFSRRYINLADSIGDINNLALRIYGAKITNYGISLDKQNVNNSIVELDSCVIESSLDIYLGFGTYVNNHIIHNSKIYLTKCNIKSNNLYIGVGLSSNYKDISNVDISLSNCNIVSKDQTRIGCSIFENINEVSNTKMTISDTIIRSDTIMLGVGAHINEHNISNTNILLSDTLIKCSGDVNIGVGNNENSGVITDTDLTLLNCLVNVKGTLTACIAYNNYGDVTNTNITLFDSRIKTKRALELGVCLCNDETVTNTTETIINSDLRGQYVFLGVGSGYNIGVISTTKTITSYTRVYSKEIIQ